MDGKGVKEDVKKATKYYKMAYERGAENAQTSYAVSCLFDNKLQRVGFDLLSALEKENDYLNNSFLALCYKYGIGTTKDDKKSEEILKNLNV